MARARQRQRSFCPWFRSSVSHRSVAGNAPAAAPPPAKAVAAPFSPSGVLAQIGARNGTCRMGSFGQPASARHQSEPAPYLTVLGAGGPEATERVPLKETSADVSIAGVIARVQVHQLFENTGRVPIEAVYVFPASTRAAVHGVRMKIGQRVIEAKIDRKQAARESYEAARREGKRASLLEQERPNVFTMNVANIMPADRIAVEMDYLEMLIPDKATYESSNRHRRPALTGGADPRAKTRWMANHTCRRRAGAVQVRHQGPPRDGIALKELVVAFAPRSRRRTRPGARRRAAGDPGRRQPRLRAALPAVGRKIESGLPYGRARAVRRKCRRENFFALMWSRPAADGGADPGPKEHLPIRLSTSASRSTCRRCRRSGPHPPSTTRSCI